MEEDEVEEYSVSNSTLEVGKWDWRTGAFFHPPSPSTLSPLHTAACTWKLWALLVAVVDLSSDVCPATLAHHKYKRSTISNMSRIPVSWVPKG